MEKGGHVSAQMTLFGMPIKEADLTARVAPVFGSFKSLRYGPTYSEPLAKAAALAGLEEKYPDELSRLRASGRHLCYLNIGLARYGVPWSVTSDLIRDDQKIDMDISGNCINNRHGAIFKDPCFAWTGQFIRSQANGSKSRVIRLWTLSRPQFIKWLGAVPASAVFAPQTA
jgi:hypothetical protein